MIMLLYVTLGMAAWVRMYNNSFWWRRPGCTRATGVIVGVVGFLSQRTGELMIIRRIKELDLEALTGLPTGIEVLFHLDR